MSFSCERAAKAMRRLVAEDAKKLRPHLDPGQRASLSWIAGRIQHGGVVLADEVGTGKTRIACAAVHAVLEAGGRAAVVVPHGLMHQWVAESKALREGAPAPKSLTSLSDFFRECSLEDRLWASAAPRPDRSEWWLISHGFRAPIVRSNANEWRAALPALVGLHLGTRATREDGRTRLGRLQAEIENMPAKRWGWNGMVRIASDIARRVRGDHDLRAQLASLPRLDVTSWNNHELLATFGNEGIGRHVTERLLGHWLGDFDLIVVDEAHKSRGEVEADEVGVGAAGGSVLTRLVDVLLRQSEAGRRLCVTATPMELDLSQWLELLQRARSGIDPEHGRRVVERLHQAASRARMAPDEGKRLDELVEASRDFSRTLAPHVTRRRRDEDPLIVAFRARLTEPPNGSAHPHRRVEAVPIPWAEVAGANSAWLEVLFAAECMSRSAQGLSFEHTEGWPRAVRDAYTKLSAGHVNLELTETNQPLKVPEEGTVDAHVRGKLVRTAYWFRRVRDARVRVLETMEAAPGLEVDPDAEHPRILAAVNEIERWTEQREKVLVFGVFLRPLRLLQDVLNVRHALRAADAGRPVGQNIHSNPSLLGIATRQLARMRVEGALSGRLASAQAAELRRALQDRHKAYERLRQDVRDGAKNSLDTWHPDASLLGGTQADGELYDALQDHLISFIVDDFLTQTATSGQPTGARIQALAQQFLDGHLRPLLGELDSDADEDLAALRQAALRRALLDDADARQSPHARLLRGGTRWETRRYLQAAFNRADTSPRVLVAQSQVGREGLNLHESCRVVVQFHAEWNPAVLEQQIGRVDRKGSLWERRARKWIADGAHGEPPFIEVRQLVFEGTYDAFQWDRVMRRQHVFNASLFGSLLPAEAWERIPQARRNELLDAAPRFRPPRPLDQ